jgi:hypothetical protein
MALICTQKAVWSLIWSWLEQKAIFTIDTRCNTAQSIFFNTRTLEYRCSLRSAIEDFKIAFERFSFTYHYCGTECGLQQALKGNFFFRNTQKISIKYSMGKQPGQGVKVLQRSRDWERWLGKTWLYKAISNNLKIGTETLTPVAWQNLVIQNHKQQPEDGDGDTDSDGLVKLGYTKP